MFLISKVIRRVKLGMSVLDQQKAVSSSIASCATVVVG
jgi:hypothetical protein